jgi:hypothetical protein
LRKAPFYSSPIMDEWLKQVRWLLTAAEKHQITEGLEEYREWLAACGEDVIRDCDQEVLQGVD